MTAKNSWSHLQEQLSLEVSSSPPELQLACRAANRTNEHPIEIHSIFLSLVMTKDASRPRELRSMDALARARCVQPATSASSAAERLPGPKHPHPERLGPIEGLRASRLLRAASWSAAMRRSPLAFILEEGRIASTRSSLRTTEDDLSEASASRDSSSLQPVRSLPDC